MSSIEIENIDVTVLSWRYAMCIKCAMNCKGITLYDLFLSSNCCKEKHHKLSKRTCLLKGIGKFTAAVEYINATRKFNVNEYFEAKYHAKCAVQKSSQYKDNLNIHVNKLAKNLLEQINRGESKEQSIPYFTLTELIVFSNKHKHEKKRDSHTCDYNTTLQSKSCSIMSSFIENSTISSNVPQRKSNKYLLLGGTNKIKEKYIEGKRVIPKKRKRKKKYKQLAENDDLSTNDKLGQIDSENFGNIESRNQGISAKKNNKNIKLPVKIVFSKTRIVTPLFTFSNITKIHEPKKIKVYKKMRDKKYKKLVIVKFKERKSINGGIQLSDDYYVNGKSLLLGGTQRRKGKRVDYVKLNSGFGTSSSSDENCKVSNIKVNYKTDANCLKSPLNASVPQELKQAFGKKVSKKMKVMSNAISLEQKKDSFISQNIIPKTPINEFLYKDIKLRTLNEDSDWVPEKHNYSTKRKRKKGYKMKKHKKHDRKT